MEPSGEDVLRLGMVNSLAGYFAWSGLEEGQQQRLATALGLRFEDLAVTHTRVLAAASEEEYVAVVNAWRPDGEAAPTLVERNRARLVHLAARSATTVPPPLPPPAAIPEAVQEAVTGIEGAMKILASPTKDARKVKASSILDTTDESEVKALTPAELTELFKNYGDLKRGPPLEEAEPTSDQLSAMHTRVVILKLEPYGDFSILTPYGRRMAKVLKRRSWLLNEDGSYRAVGAPGPSDFRTWEACWRVYVAILLMLRDKDAGGAVVEVAAPASLEQYYEGFKLLRRENQEVWRLCCKAEDRRRAERFPRPKRLLEKERGTEVTGWPEVFNVASADDRYWDREVR